MKKTLLFMLSILIMLSLVSCDTTTGPGSASNTESGKTLNISGSLETLDTPTGDYSPYTPAAGAVLEARYNAPSGAEQTLATATIEGSSFSITIPAPPEDDLLPMQASFPGATVSDSTIKGLSIMLKLTEGGTDKFIIPSNSTIDTNTFQAQSTVYTILYVDNSYTIEGSYTATDSSYGVSTPITYNISFEPGWNILKTTTSSDTQTMSVTTVMTSSTQLDMDIKWLVY